MSKEIIENQNFFYADKFVFLLNRTPKVNYNCISAEFPELTTEPQKIHTPNNPFHVGGKKIEFSTLAVTFRVDEDLTNYAEIYEWMRGISSAVSFDPYNKLIKDERFSVQTVDNGHNIYSDATIFTQTNSYNVNLAFNFINVFPIALGAIQFNLDDNTAPVLCRAEFQYDYFEIIKNT